VGNRTRDPLDAALRLAVERGALEAVKAAIEERLLGPAAPPRMPGVVAHQRELGVRADDDERLWPDQPVERDAYTTVPLAAPRPPTIEFQRDQVV
jgi:hypothetical protein